MAAKDIAIDKLRGGENFHTWKFAMQNLLEFCDLENCITDPVTETDQKKLRKAKAKIVLSVDESIYAHILNENSALCIWKKLASLYDDSGVSRKIGLLRKLITTRLENCDSITEYVNVLTDTSNKLEGIGFAISEEWLGAIMLAGLTDEFKPFIMGIESSNAKITGECIRSKLLDGDYGSTKTESAFFSKNKSDDNKNYSKNKNRLKCYNCGKKGHISNECRAKRKFYKNKTEAFSVNLSLKNNSNAEWVIDSGASRHMTPYKNILSDLKQSSISEIVAANNEKLQVIGSGKAAIELYGKTIEVNNVLLVPKLSTNLLSVSQMIENGNSVMFDKNNCKVYNNKNELIAQTKSYGGVYKFDNESVSCMIADESATLSTWHRRLGHLNYMDLRKLRDGAVSGISFADNPNILAKCEVCLRGKQTRKSFKHVGTRATELLGLIHSDLCGPMESHSVGGSKYFLTFIDDYSRKAFVYFLKSKTEVLDRFREFKEMVEKQKQKNIKIIRTDNGTEYVGHNFETFCKKHGIIHQTSNVYTPEQNGVAERFNRTIVERARCMLFDAELNKKFWAEAVNTAVYVINRSPSSTLNGKTAEGVWKGTEIDLSTLRIFGSPVMIHVPKPRRRKWDPKSQKFIFVGYSETTKGYRCMHPSTNKLVISRDVVFMEPKAKVIDSIFLEDLDMVSVRDNKPNCVVKTQSTDKTDYSLSEETIEFEDALEQSSTDDGDTTFIPNIHVDVPETLRRSERIASNQPSTNSANLVTTDCSDSDPCTVEEALNRADSESWRQAMQSELSSHTENQTWSIATLPPNRKTIRWMQ